jgi:hypothetical protein
LIWETWLRRRHADGFVEGHQLGAINKHRFNLNLVD